MTRELELRTHYQVLRLSPSATQIEIKATYHHVLLSSHPDKRQTLRAHTGPGDTIVDNVTDSESFDAARIQNAYHILSDPDSRAAYDASLARVHLPTNTTTSPRPAAIISLEEFHYTEDEGENGKQAGRWTHPCRCGGLYLITEQDMEDDRHLIACERCSEVVHIGYEVVEDEEVELDRCYNGILLSFSNRFIISYLIGQEKTSE